MGLIIIASVVGGLVYFLISDGMGASPCRKYSENFGIYFLAAFVSLTVGVVIISFHMLHEDDYLDRVYREYVREIKEAGRKTGVNPFFRFPARPNQ